MITKYKVNEVAKDFGLNNKEIIEVLGKFYEEPKKAQTALDTKELDVLFDVLTQENSVENFNSYFAMKKVEEKKEENSAPKKAEKKAEPKKEEKAQKKDAPKKEEKKADKPQKKEEKKPESKGDSKPQGQSNANPFKKNEKKKDGPMQSRTKGEMRTIDTRADNVQLDKYNERYENIAPVHSINDNVQTKQKLKQKSQQYRKQQGMRSKRRESEAERLKRIEAERAKKTLVITVPEEITVGDLAAMLKRTAAEVIKKLFSLGMMALLF